MEHVLLRAADLLTTRPTSGTRRDAIPSAMAVAYSGGLDSSALLHIARRYAADRGIRLMAFHVHHGISANADKWMEHCESACSRLQVQFEARRVDLGSPARAGVEQAARLQRYRALGALCRAYDIPLLLTAHHRDDQAETVLLRMLRGSGVAGISGMEKANLASELLGDSGRVIARPLLDVSRSMLERFVSQNGIAYVDDESNADVRYARNALRHGVMPSLAASFPGYQDRIVRTARHARSTQRLLNEVAQQDLAACLDGECIDIGRLQHFSVERVDNLLRFWFASRGVRMPATAWLEEMRAQLLDAKEDAQVRVTHPDCEIRRYRNRIVLTSRMPDAPCDENSVTFRWRHESRIDFPQYDGSLYFEEASEGLDPTWLLAHDLQIGLRRAGQKLKLAHNRPSRSLKQHYQTLDIPAWERTRLPVVTADGDLLFAAGIGMNWRQSMQCDGHGIRLRWVTTRA